MIKMDKTDLIEFNTYRFPKKTFLLTKQELENYRKLERELIIKERGLWLFIKDKEVNDG